MAAAARSRDPKQFEPLTKLTHSLCALSAAIVATLSAHAATSVFHAVLGDSRTAASAREVRLAALSKVSERRVLESSDDWLGKLKTEKFWTEKRGGRPLTDYSTSNRPQMSRLGAARPAVSTPSAPLSQKTSRDDNEFSDGSTWYHGDGDTFRTVCVRLCDGYFWPISFSTTDDNFERDQNSCERSCTSPARLYVAKTPGVSMDDMEDLKGVAYKKLKTSFLFRTSFEADCKCKPHPWEQAAMDRHRLYAAEGKRRKGDVAAAAEATRLKAEIAQASKLPASHRTLASDEPPPDEKLAAKPEQRARAAAPSQATAKPVRTASTTQRYTQTRPAAAPPGPVMRLGATQPSPVRSERPSRVAAGADWRTRSFEAR